MQAAKRPGPVGGKRDQKRKQRTQTLMSSGLSLFLERGIESVAIDDIVERAETAKGNFYRYFADKEALVAALVHPLREELATHLGGCMQALEKARDHGELLAAYQTTA